MERYWSQRIVASVLALQFAAVAHAEVQIPAYTSGADLFNETQNKPPFEGVGRIGDVTRQTGGSLYKLDLVKALPLTSLKAKPSAGKVKIVSVTLVTDKGDRIPVKAYNNVTIASTDQPLASEILSSPAPIAVVEVQAEAMGGKAALDINAISNSEIPKLNLRVEEVACKKNIDATLKEHLDVVQVWAGRAEVSAPGSIQEKYATKEFNRYVNEFISVIKNDKTAFASTEYTVTLLNFFAERHNTARAESAADVAYKNMAMETFNAFILALQSDQTCYNIGSEGMIKIATDFQKRLEGNKPDSRARKLYEAFVLGVGKLIPNQYRKELAAKSLTFRQADAEGHKYHKLVTTSKPDNFLKTTHQDMSASAYTVAEQALTREVKTMTSDQRYELIVEYQAKYNDAANYPSEIMMKYLIILSESGTLFRIYR
ncbi:beta-sandwich domain-containing protein [Bdellovibrio bacteriovorus]|uniref:Bdellovibrio beta-sandwich domain-containing protein n=1 Tax=Bdellovibrio bacteriovorus TaxID=959 RepID=A0A1Z3N9S4_BDEBC|nr:beta-sandwich domain-containing protein [Bdellovibrio bacteriovorus]ASD64224.1 hypothetical protein B9G79_11930 [Bdellovibrio bacteriovorus]